MSFIADLSSVKKCPDSEKSFSTSALPWTRDKADFTVDIVRGYLNFPEFLRAYILP